MNYVILSMLGFLSLMAQLPVSPTRSVRAEPRYPAMTNAAADEMSQTFAFCEGQRLSVEFLAEKFPELKVRLARAQRQFNIRFGAATAWIDSILSRENTSWTTGKDRWLTQLRNKVWSAKVSAVEAKAFLEEVEHRITGDVPSPFLENLLIYNPDFQRNPAEEFLRAYRKPMDLYGHEKSLGVSIRVEVPTSWRIEEGNHPHIVGKAISENGRGSTMVMVLVVQLPKPEDFAASKQDLAELFDDAALREMFPIIHSAERVTLENLPAVLVEYGQSASRLGTDFKVKGMMLMVLYKNKLVQLQCPVFRVAGSAESLDAKYERYAPLFKLIANSLVIREKWIVP